MPLDISPEALREYKRTARLRWQAEQEHRRQRLEQAWVLARQAAELLRREYGVQRVAAFGSLTQPERFTEYSDVDLMAWGLTTQNWLHAMNDVRSLSEEIELNLVDAECCSDELLASVEQNGVAL